MAILSRRCMTECLRNPAGGWCTSSLVHVIRWEAEHGPVPPGMALKCLDGNRQNTDPENWEAIPRGMLPRLAGGRWNRLPYDSAPDELKPTIMAIAKLDHAARAAAKEEG